MQEDKVMFWESYYHVEGIATMHLETLHASV